MATSHTGNVAEAVARQVATNVQDRFRGAWFHVSQNPAIEQLTDEFEDWTFFTRSPREETGVRRRSSSIDLKHVQVSPFSVRVFVFCPAAICTLRAVMGTPGSGPNLRVKIAMDILKASGVDRPVPGGEASHPHGERNAGGAVNGSP